MGDQERDEPLHGQVTWALSMLDLVSWPPEAAVRGAAAMRQHSHLGFLCVQSEALGLLVHTQPGAGTQPKHASRSKIWEAFWDNLI